MLSNFSLYPKRFEYYVVRIWVLLKSTGQSLFTFFLFVLAGKQPDDVQIASSISPTVGGLDQWQFGVQSLCDAV